MMILLRIVTTLIERNSGAHLQAATYEQSTKPTLFSSTAASSCLLYRSLSASWWTRTWGWSRSRSSSWSTRWCPPWLCLFFVQEHLSSSASLSAYPKKDEEYSGHNRKERKTSPKCVFLLCQHREVKSLVVDGD